MKNIIQDQILYLILFLIIFTTPLLAQSSLTKTNTGYTVEIVDLKAKDPLYKNVSLFVSKGIQSKQKSTLTYFRDDSGLVTLQAIVEYSTTKEYTLYFDGVEVSKSTTISHIRDAAKAIFYDRIKNKKFKD